MLDRIRTGKTAVKLSDDVLDINILQYYFEHEDFD